jgi:DnaK suppressor protein
MVARTARFTSKTLDALVARLLAHQSAVARCVEALRSEATDALRGRDVSDLFDVEDPSADSDVVTQLLLIEQAEGRLWEVEEALGRVADGTYGYCVGCGAGIPLQRLRALPAAASCVDCSRASSRRVARNLVDRDHLRSGRIRGRSPDGLGVPAAGGER